MGPYFRYPHSIEELVTEQRWFLAEVKFLAFWIYVSTIVVILVAFGDMVVKMERWTQKQILERQTLRERLLPEEQSEKEEKALTQSTNETTKNLWAGILKHLGRQPGAGSQQTDLTVSRGETKHDEASDDNSPTSTDGPELSKNEDQTKLPSMTSI